MEFSFVQPCVSADATAHLARIIPATLFQASLECEHGTVRIEHVALWTEDLDKCQRFYVEYFGAVAGARYRNEAKGFESVFLSFGGGARLEIMRTTSFTPVVIAPGAQRLGLTHLAISVGSEQLVDTLSARLRSDGFSILDGPRRTGDGYYESVVLDPDGNRVEITV